MKKQFITLLLLLGCTHVSAIEQTDGVYQIGTAEDLVAFATLVNDGTTSANAVLTADIDMTGYGEKYPMIGNSGNPYAGVFDGQFHTISHLVLEREQGDVALVSYAQPGCTIKNLVLDETCSASGASHTAGIVSRFTGAHQPIYLLNLGYEGTITDLGINAGGIHANSPSAGPITVMKNCYSTGKINGTDYNGQLSGWVGRDAIVENCWSTSEVTGTRSDEFFRRSSATQTNCYSKYGTQATLITDEQVASGELTYLLNQGDIQNPTWRQTIGSDNTPVFNTTHGIVNKIGATGYATQYIPGSAVQVPSGVSVFTGLIDTPWIALRPLSGIIPAGEAVVLQGAEGYYSFVPTIATSALGNNELKGTAEPLTTNGTQYVLAEKDGVVGFYKAEGTIPAGKAYIEYASAGVKAFFFGDATGLTPTLSQGVGETAAVYDLSGRRVERVQKGMYIINGKKVIK